ncbi:MAG: DUF2062 domain-containing protein [Dongiaceae bacterium]
MFRRRLRRHPIRRLKELLWPSAGWRRSTVYLAHRLRRLPGTPYSIAAGFACGAALAVTPFIGFHFVAAALLAWLIRGSLLAAAFGTLIGNPWTYPPIFLWTYHLGNWMLGDGGTSPVPEELTLGGLIEHPFQALLPMAVGSVPTAAFVGAATFWAVRAAVTGYRRARRRLAPGSGR